MSRKDDVTMKKLTLSFVMSLVVAVLLGLFGCAGPEEPSANDGPATTSAADETAAGGPSADEPATGEEPAAQEADFSIVVGEAEYLAGSDGKDLVKISYELINKGATAVPNAVSTVKASQGSAELTAATIDGETGAVDYQVRSGGSVQCWAAFELADTSDVTVEFLNITKPSAPPVQTQVVPAQ
jgi:hypothetical protein